MISIIICSINPTLLQQVSLNIEETIGVPYEIIAIDNRGTNDGICKVYNKGGERASYPILCFVHEDVLFKTPGWGQLMANHFTNTRIGLIGVAGGDTKGVVPSTWSTSLKSNEINIIQNNCDGNGRRVSLSASGKAKPFTNAVTLDGVLLCTRKDIFKKIKFDEISLNGFHGYDIDYSLQVLTGYEVVVIRDVLIHHFSEGKPDREWLKSAFIISRKWKKLLPVSLYSLSPKDFNYYHWKSLQVFLEHLFRLNYSYPKIIFYYLKYSFSKYFRIRRFLSMGKYVATMMYEKSFAKDASKENETGDVANKIIKMESTYKSRY